MLIRRLKNTEFYIILQQKYGKNIINAAFKTCFNSSMYDRRSTDIITDHSLSEASLSSTKIQPLTRHKIRSDSTEYRNFQHERTCERGLEIFADALPHRP